MDEVREPLADVTSAADVEIEIPSTDDPVLSIVIVTHGTGPIVLDALRSIVGTAEASTPYEVIVVDNAGAAISTADLLEAGTSGVRLVRMPTNIGFGPGNDVGVSLARGALVCLCNPDIVLPPGWLPPLRAALADPAVGIAAPPLINADGSLQEAGQLLYDDGCTAAVGGPEVAPGDWSHTFTRDVDYASAAFWLLRRSEFLGFNPRLVPAYFEDVDYALRLEAQGQVTRLVVDRPVTHLHGASAAGEVSAIAERSREIFRAEWSARIGNQLRRPTTPGDLVASRDRSCAERVAVLAGRPRDWADAASAAIDWARRMPRQRCTVFVRQAPAEDVGALRRAGVEVVEGDPAVGLAARPGWATRVVVVGGRADGATKRAVRVTQDRVATIERVAQGGAI